MPHYNAYDSFKSKKSLERKKRIKEKLSKKVDNIDDFIIDENDSYGIVIEVRYDEAYVLLDDEIILAKLRKDINKVCNQIIFPGDKVVILCR